MANYKTSLRTYQFLCSWSRGVLCWTSVNLIQRLRSAFKLVSVLYFYCCECCWNILIDQFCRGKSSAKQRSYSGTSEEVSDSNVASSMFVRVRTRPAKARHQVMTRLMRQKAQNGVTEDQKSQVKYNLHLKNVEKRATNQMTSEADHKPCKSTEVICEWGQTQT